MNIHTSDAARPDAANPGTAKPDSAKPPISIGIDVGGTFTDFVVVEGNSAPRYFKTASTPQAPSDAVMNGLGDIAESHGLSTAELMSRIRLFIHGTTVATNTLLERKGARVGLITTEGFRDLLALREGLKEDRYNLRMPPVEPLVPRSLRHTLEERIRSDGTVEAPVDNEALDEILDELARAGVESVAVCLVFSYLNPAHERLVGDRIRQRHPELYLSLSSEILPQIKEYDRLSTTAVNAYVGPVYARYLERMKEEASGLGLASDILTMTSNGGVTPLDVASRQAVQAILSGPAGGVSGAVAYGRLIGEGDLIGFDMGGTSTDISVIEAGDPQVSGEHYEGGWKIAVPMIDLHTLGAGGGSIARVDDGGTLHVGPQSAGADPGPACYGRGGDQPTVTDANLVLGYLDPGNFLGGRNPLYPDLSEQAVQASVAEPLGLSTVDAARGILDVVTTAMAEGIRLLTVRRGGDPRNYALLAFGGAAGLHVGQVARKTGIGKVYLPSAAPVLSAYGMLASDLRYDFAQSFTASLDVVDLDEVRRLTDRMAGQGIARLRNQGLAEEDIATRFTADMRYLDQIYEVNVTVPDLAIDDDAIRRAWASLFHERYQTLYSYHQLDQEIRLVTLRATVTGKLPSVDLPARERSDRNENARKGTRRVYTGTWTEVAVYVADDLAPGTEIDGPAIVESDFTTVLVEADDRLEVDPYGGMVLAVSPAAAEAPDALEVSDSSDALDAPDTPESTKAPEAPEAPDADPSRSDPVTHSVVGHRLESIAREMADVMIRTSMSQILNSSRDFSTAILDATGQLVAQGEGIPVHISALPPSVEAVREYFGDDIDEGDLFILNDPYFGGSHLPDITAIYPVFRDGSLLFFAVNRAHHSDIGGGTHGGYNPSASELYHEGLRIPPVKLYEAGRPREDLLHMLAVNVRHAENFTGDLHAQIGSVQIAARRLQTLLDDYGADGLTASVEAILDSAERRIRQLIGGWKDGVYFGETLLDDDGFDAESIPIRAKVTVQDDHMTIDLSESSPQVTGFINSAYANTRSLAHVAIMYMAPSDVPKNEGSMRPVKVIAPRGLIVNPNPPAPVCMSTNHCGEEIVEAVFKALAPVAPDAVNAGFSRRLRFAITGRNPRTGNRFIWHFFFGRGGGGASRGYDGWSCVGEVNVAGAIRSPSVEITEERFPFKIVRNDLRPGSGGDGTWRGGLGAVFEMAYEGDEPAKLNMAGDGVVNPPFGLFGGEPGLPHLYKVVSNGKERMLKSKETEVPILPGDRIIALSAGGGGYGPPGSRNPDSRSRDRESGLA
ncbi:MAG: hydantoinase B/oxoprolinase family protein [Gemmatimonadetes bacterium]|nr:hydantoinase B/oxoprolinase family protein [Gemmatimonadota bacterium]